MIGILMLNYFIRLEGIFKKRFIETKHLQCKDNFLSISNTEKPVLSGHSKIDKTKDLKTDGNLMKVKSIVECSCWSILQYLRPS